jgi:hypothetical protein
LAARVLRAARAIRVMVIPGFLGNDGYLETLRGWLRRIGYVPLASGTQPQHWVQAGVVGSP